MRICLLRPGGIGQEIVKGTCSSAGHVTEQGDDHGSDKPEDLSFQGNPPFRDMLFNTPDIHI